MGEGTDMEKKMLRAGGCVITLLATVVVIACEDGSSSSVSPASPSSLPFALSSQNASGGLPFELSDGGDGGSKVRLCHVTGNGSYQLLEVDENAREAHEGHGDGYPAGAEVVDRPLKAGEVPGEDQAVFDEECRILRPSVDIEKATNGEDADAVPGPTILEGAPVEWTFVVTNTGDFDLIYVMVTDTVLGTVTDIDIMMMCVDDSGAPADASLAPGDSMTCTLMGTAGAIPYANLGAVTAVIDTGSPDLILDDVSDSDPSHYLGVDPDAEPEEDDGPKVDLCHKTGNNGRYILINVAAAAVPAHLAHGDARPGESVPSEPGMIFSPNCSVVSG